MESKYLSFNSIRMSSINKSNELKILVQKDIIRLRDYLYDNRKISSSDNIDIETSIILKQIRDFGVPKKEITDPISYKNSVKTDEILEYSKNIIQRSIKALEEFYDIFEEMDKLQRMGNVYIKRKRLLDTSFREFDGIDEFSLPFNSNGMLKLELLFKDENKQNLYILKELDIRYSNFKIKRFKLLNKFKDEINKDISRYGDYNVFEHIITYYKD